VLTTASSRAMLVSVTTPATLFASSAADITLGRVRQLVDQNLPEGLTLEYKEAYDRSFVKSVAAMANSYGGIILVGVKDGSGVDRLIGVDEGVIVQIINACHDSLEPPWEPEVVAVPLDDESGKLVLVVRVDPARAPRPVLLGGSAPIRLQGRNATADRSRLAMLFAESATVSAGTRQVLQQPVLPAKTGGGTDADFILRSGFWLPLGEAAGWRPLPESGVDELRDALNRSALGHMLGKWAGRLHISDLVRFDRIGFNRARNARLVWRAVPPRWDFHPVEAIAQLDLPVPRGAAATSASFTVDVVMRVGAYYEGAKAKGWPMIVPWLVQAADVLEVIGGVLGGLVDGQVVQVLADIAGIDPVIVPQPPEMHLLTDRAVGDLLSLKGLVAIPDAGNSHGANLVADSTLDLSDPDDRQIQVDAWVQQIALDAGLRGMEGVLAKLRQARESSDQDGPAE